MLKEKEIIISFITELEMLSNPDLSKESEDIIRGLLSNCIIINISNKIKLATVNFRKKYKLKLPDSIIAATASGLNLPVITSDQQFRKIDSLEIILYEPR